MVVHRFAPGAYVCRCGERVIPKPEKKWRAGVYGKFSGATHQKESE